MTIAAVLFSPRCVPFTTSLVIVPASHPTLDADSRSHWQRLVANSNLEPYPGRVQGRNAMLWPGIPFP